jgi:hypothetical protein
MDSNAVGRDKRMEVQNQHQIFNVWYKGKCYFGGDGILKFSSFWVGKLTYIIDSILNLVPDTIISFTTVIIINTSGKNTRKFSIYYRQHVNVYSNISEWFIIIIIIIIINIITGHSAAESACK